LTGTTLTYSTYLGGSGYDRGFGLAVDAGGEAYVTGVAQSTDFPTTTGAFQTSPCCGAFVTKLNVTGTALVYSTYLGVANATFGNGIAVDGGGAAYVTGIISAPGFPTTAGAFQTTWGGGLDAFVAKLNAAGTALAYSTYLGGSSSDGAYGIALDSGAAAYLTGYTQSVNFPTTAGAFQTTFDGVMQAFVASLNAAGTTLAYSTFLGGGSYDQGSGIAVDSLGAAYVAGETQSSDFPTTPGAFRTTKQAASDAFVAKFGASDLQVTAVSEPPATADLGSGFMVTDTTANYGSISSAGSTNRYYVSLDTVLSGGDKRLSGSRVVPGLAPGAESTGSKMVAIPTSTKIGTYFLLACADDAKKVTESNETNNCRASSTRVEVRGPDLVESAVSDPPAGARRGTTFLVMDTVLNLGLGAAGKSITRYYVSTDKFWSKLDVQLAGGREVPGLLPKADSTGSETVGIPSTMATGYYYLLACADDLRRVAETNEKNNCRASGTRVLVGR
jgi:hypothetical protein